MSRKRSDIDRAAVFEAILGDLGPAEERGPEASGVTVPLRSVRFNARQPRKHVGEERLADLAASIEEKGVLEPIIVRRVGGGFEIVAGERRTRAAALAGLSEIPAIIVDIDDREALEIAIIENLQREDLNAVEETEAVLGLLEMSLNANRDEVIGLLNALYSEERGRGSTRKVTERQRAMVSDQFRRLGRFTVSSFVSNRLPILEFPEALLEAVRSGQLAFTKAQALARLEDADARQRLLAVAIAEELSLSQIRRRITELRRSASEKDVLAAGQLERTQALVSSTKRLLTKNRLAALDRGRLTRIAGLLAELRTVLDEEQEG